MKSLGDYDRNPPFKEGKKTVKGNTMREIKRQKDYTNINIYIYIYRVFMR